LKLNLDEKYKPFYLPDVIIAHLSAEDLHQKIKKIFPTLNRRENNCDNIKHEHIYIFK